MKGLLRELLDTEAEAQRLVAEAEARAADIRREAAEEAETCRRSRRADTDEKERMILAAAAQQTAGEEGRILAASESEIAAIQRRFEDRRTVVAEMLAQRVLPSSRGEG